MVGILPIVVRDRMKVSAHGTLNTAATRTNKTKSRNAIRTCRRGIVDD